MGLAGPDWSRLAAECLGTIELRALPVQSVRNDDPEMLLVSVRMARGPILLKNVDRELQVESRKRQAGLIKQV